MVGHVPSVGKRRGLRIQNRWAGWWAGTLDSCLGAHPFQAVGVGGVKGAGGENDTEKKKEWKNMFNLFTSNTHTKDGCNKKESGEQSWNELGLYMWKTSLHTFFLLPNFMITVINRLQIGVQISLHYTGLGTKHDHNCMNNHHYIKIWISCKKVSIQKYIYYNILTCIKKTFQNVSQCT